MTASAPETCVPDRKAFEVLQVIARSPKSLQNCLDRAVQHVRQAALADDFRGILIIRRSETLFTVEASEKVPYGITMESDRWDRRALTAPTSAGQAGTL